VKPPNNFVEELETILSNRDYAIRVLMDSLDHLSRERQYAIITSWIDVDQLMEIAEFQAEKSGILWRPKTKDILTMETLRADILKTISDKALPIPEICHRLNYETSGQEVFDILEDLYQQELVNKSTRRQIIHWKKAA
jgi:hypothetical protein